MDNEQPTHRQAKHPGLAIRRFPHKENTIKHFRILILAILALCCSPIAQTPPTAENPGRIDIDTLMGGLNVSQGIGAAKERAKAS